MDKYNEDESLEGVTWTKYKIIVPTERDRNELMEAFEHLHYTDCDTDLVAVNQLVHEYLCEEVTGDPKSINNIIVNKKLYDKL
jgi:hypothetical protein